jgi:hypothetical protein
MKQILTALFVLGLAGAASAQTIPQPSGPVAFCGVQASPTATSHKVSFNGGTPEDVAFVTPTSTGAVVDFCNANAPKGWTHAFTLPAARFTIGKHTVVVISINQFGQTSGPVWVTEVGIKPGPLTVTAAGQLPSN